MVAVYVRLMSIASCFAKPQERWANELWNLSFLPLATPARAEFPANDRELSRPRLENVDRVRSAERISGGLQLEPRPASVILPR